MRTRVKICGITRIEDALLAARLGADAIGLVFYSPSPRNVSVSMASDIVAALPPFVSKVGLFVNATKAEIDSVLSDVALDCLQFHGDEAVDACEGYNLPYIKAIRMKPGLDVSAVASEYSSATGILLDAYQAGMPGGTGQTFDWAEIPAEIADSVILAGGLKSENVATAISQVNPYAVDVSGGVEAAKGKKDPQKMVAFISEVERVGKR